MRKLGVYILAVLVGFSLLGSVAHAAKPVISIDGTDWTLSGKTNVNVAKVGKAKIEGDVQLLIGPNGGENLGATDFKLIDGGGSSFTGTFALDKKGYVFTPDSDELKAHLENLLIEMAAADQLQVTVTNIDLGTIKMSVKPKYTKIGIGITFSANVKATVTGTLDGQPLDTTKVSLAMKHTGELEIPFAGSTWLMDTKVQAALKSMAKQKDTGTMTLSIGPNPGEGLAEGEYKGLGDQGELFTGSFTTDAKGNVAFSVNEQQVEAVIELMFMAQIDPAMGVTDIAIDIITDKTKMIVKSKPGKSIILSIKLTFDVQLTTTAFGTLDSSGTLSVKGTGVPML
jgi:hypothetical protein